MKNSPQIKITSAAVESQCEKWVTFLTFVGFSILDVWILISVNLNFAKLGDWIIVGGALFFPVMTAISWKSLVNNWSVEKSDRAFARLIGWVIGAPAFYAAIILAIWVLFSFFGWLQTIQLGAIGIIIILLMRR